VKTNTDNPVAIVRSRMDAFIQTLNNAGFETAPAQVQLAYQLCCTPIIESAPVCRASLRALFSQDRDQWQRFNGIFNLYWFAPPADGEATEASLLISRSAGASAGMAFFSESQTQDSASPMTSEAGTDLVAGGAGEARMLSKRDFRFVFNPQHMRAIERQVDELARRVKKQVLRRNHSTANKGRIDAARVARKNLATGGWPFTLRFKQRSRNPARFVLLLDVSQSMEIYSALFLRFARGVLQAFADTDAFAFHTDLVPIGSELKEKNPRKLESKLKELSSGWLGGTRIASSLHRFNSEHAARVINRHTIVFVFSDGYDSGDPDDLLTEVLDIRQRCKRLVWVNPLLGRQGPDDVSLPIERCMNAVIPEVDQYLSAHNIESLKQLTPAFSLR
jgi:uncharacterized protein with von Willebrand factor type A (vWA) domain